MSLKSYFPEQFDELKAFFISATEVVRQLKADPEMRAMLNKALARMDEERDFPHALAWCQARFEEPVGYFDQLLAIAKRSYQENEQALTEQKVAFTPPADEDARIKSPAKFARYISALANGLPDQIGSLVFVLDPQDVTDAQAFRRSMLYLAEHVHSKWVKFLVFDSRTAPMLDGIEKEQDHIGVQTFYLSPDEIEKRTREDLKSGNTLPPAERRQYMGLLAGFAYSHKNYDEAIKLQRAWANEAEHEKQYGDAATANYNLANTLLAKGELELATQTFCKACDLCVEHKVHGLAPFVYVNLGVCLHRQNQFEAAFASLKVARDMFKAQNHRAGEAYVVDALAQMYALDGRTADAEKSWRYCLSLYDSMTSSVFKDLSTSGREDILTKLKRIGVTVDPPPPAVPAPAKDNP